MKSSPRIRAFAAAGAIIFGFGLLAQGQGVPPRNDDGEGAGRQISCFGKVTDLANKPLAGIQIEIQGAARQRSGRPPLVTTGADGTYQIGPAELRAGAPKITLYAGGKDYVSETKEIDVSSSPTQPVRVDFTLKDGHWIAGRIVDEKGNPLGGIEVSIDRSMIAAEATPGSPFLGMGTDIFGGTDVRFPLSGPSRIQTKSDGKFRFECLPNVTVDVRVTRLSPGLFASVSGRAEADRETEIVIPGPGVIRGRIIDAATKMPVAKFSVSNRGEESYLSDESTGPKSKPFADPDGRFVLNDADRSQPNRLTVHSEGYAELVREHVRAENANSTGTARELALELFSSKELKISLVDKATGAPIAGATLIAGVLSKNLAIHQLDALTIPSSGMITNRQPLTTDANGVAVASEGGETLSLLIWAPGYPFKPVLPDDRPHYADGEGRIKIALSHGNSIFGTVRLDGKPAAGLGIILNTTRGPRGNPGPRLLSDLPASIDETGHYNFSGVLAGPFSIQLLKQSGNERFSVISKRGQLADGEDLIFNVGEEEIASGLFGIVEQNGKPAVNARVTLRPAFDWDYTEFQTRTNENGEYRILGLRPGNYDASISSAFNSFVMPGAEATPAEPVFANETVAAGPGFAPVRHDFKLLPRVKATLHLTFPGDFPPDLRKAISGGILAPVTESAWARPRLADADPNRLRRRGERENGERLVFKGNLQGTYRLTVIATVPKGSEEGGFQGEMKSIQIAVGEPLKIDNTKGDVDLGDVEVAVPAGAAAGK